MKTWPPQANQGCSTGGKVLGAVLGARECAEPDTTLMAESEEELKSLLIKVKEEGENVA